MARRGMIACAAALLTLVALPAAAMQPANATSRAATDVARDHWQEQTSATLSKRPDVDSLVTAAVLQGNHQVKLRLLDRAAKAHPGAADIATLAQMTCTFSKDCDDVSRGAHLHAIDPDNALAWMPALHAARAQSDATKVTDLLQRMAQSKKFGTYRLSITARVQRGLASLPLSPDPSLAKLSDADARNLQASALSLSSNAIPAYQTVLRACPPNRVQSSQRRASCRQIGLLLEQSDARIDNHIGLALHRRAAANAADYAQALATGRRLDWQLHQYALLPGTDAAAGVAAYMQTTLTHHGDMAGIQARLTKAGVALDPPDSWVDKAQASNIARDKKASRSAGTSPGSAEHG